MTTPYRPALIWGRHRYGESAWGEDIDAVYTFNDRPKWARPGRFPFERGGIWTWLLWWCP